MLKKIILWSWFSLDYLFHEVFGEERGGERDGERGRGRGEGGGGIGEWKEWIGD